MIRIPAVLICITFHELAHGFVAYKLGDDTARLQGRLTLNPIAHIDPIGLLCMVIAGFGWAKPVPITPHRFRLRNKKVGIAITALAGPVANLLLAFASLIAYILTIRYGAGAVASAFATFMQTFILLNIGLAVFNLIPIPPLDGSKVLMPFLPDRLLELIQKYEGFIRFFFLIAVFLNAFNGIISAGILFIFRHLYTAVLFLLNLFGVL